MQRLSKARHRILTLLGDGENTVTHLAKVMDRKPTNVSRDLRIMYTAGLVDRRRDGQCVPYWLTAEGREAL